MNSEWQEASLGSLAKVELGKMLDKKKNQGEYRNYIGNDNVQWGYFKLDDIKKMRIKDSELERFRVEPGDLMVCEGGDPGRCALWASDAEMYYQKALNRVRVGENLIPSFLLYYMIHLGRTHEIRQYFTGGATIKHLPNAALKRVVIRYPAIDVQKKISATLASYDKLIENNRKQIALLEEAAQRLYKEWFVDMRFPGYSSVNIQDGLPQGWERCMLPEFADIQYGFAFHADNFNTSRDGRPIVRIRNVPTGYSSDYTTEVADEKYIVKDGDILIGMDGVFYINLWHGGDAYLVQRTCCVRPKIEAYRGYLEQAVREPIAAFQNGIVGATVAHLGKKHLDSIHIVVPPATLVGPLDVMAQQRLTLSKEIVMLSEARDRLLPKLMSGEIEV